ncbi:MAG: hypothetical protein WAO35_06815 [Terriglobia bacterium]
MGPVSVARHLWDELALGLILDGKHPRRRHGQPLSKPAFVLTANRLSHPGREHALAEWLEQAYVSNGRVSRWQPQWKPWRRVKVSFDQLRLWYQTLDDLGAEKARIEKEIYPQLRTLFSLRADLVFYDITSTYFEGEGPGQEVLKALGITRLDPPQPLAGEGTVM